MINAEELFEINNGLKVTDDEGGELGPVFTGGPNLPFGLDIPIDSLYVQSRPDGVLVWRKYGAGFDEWLVENNTHRVDLVDYDIKVPASNVYDLREREINCELYVDGEVYVV